MANELREFTLRDALTRMHSPTSSIPVLYDLDIGHLPPQLLLVNGALATLRFGPAEKALTQRLV